MEKWEQDKVDRLEKRVWDLERREGMRVHLNMMYLLWMMIVGTIGAEIVIAIVHHAQHSH